MPTYLGYKHVFLNCFYSTYGRKNALKNGEQTYCLRGEHYYVHNNKKVNDNVCDDWLNGRCKGLQEVTGIVK
ncbi:MAG: hypothetical protein K9L17_02815 [Clostridiales bacterium]|nr:hypothetical protein [Clostridiales bacterium]MCF8021612.1 hypothetical protein [Clostridiales bacterium]